MHPIAKPQDRASPAQIAPHHNGPSIRLVMLGFVLALGCVIGAGAALHPPVGIAKLAGSTLALR